jgi:hypothetical protein
MFLSPSGWWLSGAFELAGNRAIMYRNLHIAVWATQKEYDAE